MQRTLTRSIKRKNNKRFKKAQKKVAAGTRNIKMKPLSAGNQIQPEKKRKPTAAERFRTLIKNIIKKVTSWVA